jgi:hypothetical protein
MQFLKIIAFVIVIIYLMVLLLLYVFQTKLIFMPGKLAQTFRFKKVNNIEEVFLKTEDDITINGLCYTGDRKEVILYFHGNAGDLSGWQFVAEDFTALGYNVMIIDYRGYGKSSGTISEKGFYADALAAYDFLTINKKISPDHIIAYGRSIGTGVAVELACKKKVKGLVLESAYTSLPALANEKLPFFFPSLYLKFRFDNMSKINQVKCPVILLHGGLDTLIPLSHSQRLLKTFTGKKKMVLFPQGAHNDLNSFEIYQQFLNNDIPTFF